MSHSIFLKQLLLHPIDFLSQYFKDDRTPVELQKKTWYWVFKLPVYIMSAFCVPAALIGFYFIGPFALLLLLLPILWAIAIHTAIFLSTWISHISWKSADLSISKTKNRNLVLYMTVIGMVTEFALGVGLFVPSRYIFSEFLSNAITVIAHLFLTLYLSVLHYKICNKLTSISIKRYLVYFILLPSLILVGILAIIGTLLALAYMAYIYLVLWYYYPLLLS